MRIPRVRAAAMALLTLVVVAPLSPARGTGVTSPVTGPRLNAVRVIETLGDSVPSGFGCGCRPFPTLVASRLAALTGPPVVSYNDSRSGLVAGNVLSQLRGDATVRAHVRAAQVVVVEIGANDVQYSSACATTVSCYTSRLPRIRSTLAQIVGSIRALTSGRRVEVVLLGYWNVWLDGRYAAARGAAYVRASDAVTRATNGAVGAVAGTTGAAYGDLWLAFRGTTSRDDTALLASDGDHPNASGHAIIAAAVVRVLLSTLSTVPYPPVALAHLAVGSRNADVMTYQEALRAFLVHVGALGSLDPSGITDSYGPAARAMTRAAYVYKARTTRDRSWLSGDLTVPGAGMLKVVGLRLA